MELSPDKGSYRGQEDDISSSKDTSDVGEESE